MSLSRSSFIKGFISLLLPRFKTVTFASSALTSVGLSKSMRSAMFVPYSLVLNEWYVDDTSGCVNGPKDGSA